MHPLPNLLTKPARWPGVFCRPLMVFPTVFLLLLSCAPAKPTATTPADTSRAPRRTPDAAPAADPYMADVARFRPSIKGQVAGTPVASASTSRADVTVRADAQLETLAAAGRAIKTAPGYRILAYTGASRDEAMRIRTAVIRRDPLEKDYLQYEQPTFRLKIGDYLTRLEAEQALARWRDVIPQGLLIAEPVNVR